MTMTGDWRKSSYCGSSACVEVAFERSTFCGAGSCVEVGHDDGDVLVRDSKDLTIAPLRFTTDEWKAFVAGVKAGQFDA